MAKEQLPIIAKKSYKDGHVSVAVKLKARGWNSDTIKTEGSTDITSAQARELGLALMQCADQADAKVDAKAKKEEGRRKYREREIAAGRMIVMRGLK